MTTPDPATLREALDEDLWDDYDLFMPIRLSESGETVLAAARWALDLIEGGKRVPWCVEHDAPVGMSAVTTRWSECTKKRDGWRLNTDCNIVKRLVLGPVGETARETYLRTAHDELGGKDSSAR